MIYAFIHEFPDECENAGFFKHFEMHQQVRMKFVGNREEKLLANFSLFIPAANDNR